MKIIVAIQRLLSILAVCVGIFLTFSETSETSGVSEQLWITFGGVALIVISVLWMKLTDFEEEKWFETR